MHIAKWTVPAVAFRGPNRGCDLGAVQASRQTLILPNDVVYYAGGMRHAPSEKQLI